MLTSDHEHHCTAVDQFPLRVAFHKLVKSHWWIFSFHGTILSSVRQRIKSCVYDIVSLNQVQVIDSCYHFILVVHLVNIGLLVCEEGLGKRLWGSYC